MGVINEKNAEI